MLVIKWIILFLLILPLSLLHFHLTFSLSGDLLTLHFSLHQLKLFAAALLEHILSLLIKRFLFLRLLTLKSALLDGLPLGVLPGGLVRHNLRVYQSLLLKSLCLSLAHLLPSRLLRRNLLGIVLHALLTLQSFALGRKLCSLLLCQSSSLQSGLQLALMLKLLGVKLV